MDRPPLKNLELDVAEDVMRWVSNNEGVYREKQNAHFRKISSQVSFYVTGVGRLMTFGLVLWILSFLDI